MIETLEKLPRENFPKQTKFRKLGETGNCWSYCIAYILGVNPEGVPHFLEEAIRKCLNVESHTQRWLNQHGYWMTSAEHFQFPRHSGEHPSTISCGPTSRSKKMGEHHSVVYNKGVIVYDPHPDETGLTYISEEFLIFRPVVERSNLDASCNLI